MQGALCSASAVFFSDILTSPRFRGLRLEAEKSSSLAQFEKWHMDEDDGNLARDANIIQISLSRESNGSDYAIARIKITWLGMLCGTRE